MNIIEQILGSSNLASILGEYAISRTLDSVLNYKKTLTETHKVEVEVDFNYKETENAVLKHLQNSANWANSLSIHMFNVSHKTEFVYVDLKVKNYRRTHSLEESHIKEESIPFNNLQQSIDENIVILANPGSGKTSLLKRHCLTLIKNFKESEPLPIALPLRDIEKHSNTKNLFLTNYLLDRFEISIAVKTTDKQTEDRVLMDTVIHFLNEWNIHLILDGFDEISDLNKRISLFNEINYYSSVKTKFKLIISSRFGETLPTNSNLLFFELIPPSKSQIILFVNHYLNSNDQIKSDFYEKLMNSSFSDTTKTPLLLTFYCIYFNYYGFLPSQPSALYSKITSLFVEEWSKLNSVIRLSKFSKFDFNIKE